MHSQRLYSREDAVIGILQLMKCEQKMHILKTGLEKKKG